MISSLSSAVKGSMCSFSVGSTISPAIPLKGFELSNFELTAHSQQAANCVSTRLAVYAELLPAR
jgi:hypothetical protein